ncbi:MAG: hypothetical protein BWY99_01226 [Synergistetes bacterium ADurb.BinA166]|nr:MAG: hypothetical protein BWY99_01226 [Synergistetes bacterium ADurb.BinA166]
MRSTGGSSARFRKSTRLPPCPPAVSLSRKYAASSCFIPMPANTTAKFSAPASLDWVAICTASALWGRPLPEKIGSFCPRIRVSSTSIDETPVEMKSLGYSLPIGFIAAPPTGRRTPPSTGPQSSSGSPSPEKVLPSMAGDRAISSSRPVNRTDVPAGESPSVPANTCTSVAFSLTRTTRPVREVPSCERTSTISSYPAWGIPPSIRNGPEMLFTPTYSVLIRASRSRSRESQGARGQSPSCVSPAAS